jgi:protein CpxP
MALERIGHNQRCPQNNHTEAQTMLQLISSAPRGIVAATLLGAALVASPVRAAAVDQPTQAAPVQLAADQTGAAAKPKHSPLERSEAHIKSLHDKLKITPAQEPQWGAVAQAMRDNAQKMEVAIQQRQEAKTLTAIDDLKAYQAIADAHSQGLQVLIPAFQALYASMSDEQKQNADTMFSQSREHRHRASK